MDAYPLGRMVGELAKEGHKKINRILNDQDRKAISQTHDHFTRQVLGFILSKLETREIDLGQIVGSLTGEIRMQLEQTAIGSAFSSGSDIRSGRRVIVGAREIPTLPSGSRES